MNILIMENLAGILRNRDKGMSGKMLAFLASLIIGIVALILLWVFFGEIVDSMVGYVEDAIDGIRCWICEILGVWSFTFGNLCKNCPS